jgi:hypothetical protein
MTPFVKRSIKKKKTEGRRDETIEYFTNALAAAL